MRVLVLSPSLPWPLDAGGRIRTYQLLRELQRSHEIALWCVRQPGAGAEDESALREVCSELRVFERSRRGMLASLCGPRPETWFYSREACEALEGVGHELDLIHVDELCLSRSLPRRVPCPVLVHHHKLDLEYVSAIERSTARRMLEVRRWSRLEHETLARTREHVFCCEEDAQRFAARHRQAHTHVVENGVDLEHFSPEDRPRDPDHLLALGSLDYEPNARGLETFLASAWPRLRAALPALELSIVGRGSDPHRWRHLPPGARLVGAVEDVRPWLARATALVVPLAAGGGTRLKIVEAAAMNCPVVSTRVGAEGLALEPGEHLLLAEDTESLAEPLLQALGDPAALRRRASAARERVAQRYGWSNLGARLGQIWLDVASSSSRPAPTMR